MKINKAKLPKFEAVREVTFRCWAASGLTSEVKCGGLLTEEKVVDNLMCRELLLDP